jgi:hypothetical protein
MCVHTHIPLLHLHACHIVFSRSSFLSVGSFVQFASVCPQWSACRWMFPLCSIGGHLEKPQLRCLMGLSSWSSLLRCLLWGSGYLLSVHFYLTLYTAALCRSWSPVLFLQGEYLWPYMVISLRVPREDTPWEFCRLTPLCTYTSDSEKCLAY